MSDDLIKDDAETPIRKSTFSKLLIGIVAALVVSSFLGGYIVGSGEIKNSLLEPSQPTELSQTAQLTQDTDPGRILVSSDDDPVKGNLEASVTIVEFSDYQCPFCARFFRDTLPDLRQDYIDTGKVKFVYRDFPLESIHSNAISSALAAECANEQEKFWEYHDKLFQSQGEWASLSKGGSSNKFKEFAADLGLNSDKFRSCFDSGKYLNEINKDFQDGVKYGTSGTPAFFIGNDKNGYIKIVGAQPYSVFQQVIDQELAR
ncbi:MAG: DsbA family protein [Nitrososphaerales archaeon]